MRGSRIVLVSLLVATLTTLGGDARAASCAPGEHAGGDWASYGQNLSNTRSQPAETEIGVDNVGDLGGAWAFSSTDGTGAGSFQVTPVIAGGCVFISSSIGSFYAINADTGELVWEATMPSPLGFFSPSVVDGRVHLLAASLGVTYAVALDQQTGERLWLTPLTDQHMGIVNASSVVSDGLMFVGAGGRDLLDPFTRPPFFILDAETGEVLKKTYVIPDDEAFDGTSPYGGGGIWATAAVDTESKYLYVGTANPYSKKSEHERTNSIIKVDFDPSRETFGEIVGNYKGDVDYIPENYNSIECQNLGDAQPVGYSIFCGQQDVDFGASPNLYRHADGRLIVGEFQKSGAYHAVDTETMERVWRTEMAPPLAGGNSATSAFSGDQVFVTTSDGEVNALDKDTGEVNWTAPITGGGYQPVTVANGVVYALGASGELFGIDAATGDILLNSPNSACSGTSAAGIAVARNTVYAACDTGANGSGVLFAYSL